jgi:predicted phosphoribosyltransferase
MAKTKDPVQVAQAAVDKVADGWRVTTAVPVSAETVSGITQQAAIASVVARPGQYEAVKRVNGNLVEMSGDSVEQLVSRIEGWEAAQHPAERG